MSLLYDEDEVESVLELVSENPCLSAVQKPLAGLLRAAHVDCAITNTEVDSVASQTMTALVSALCAAHCKPGIFRRVVKAMHNALSELEKRVLPNTFAETPERIRDACIVDLSGAWHGRFIPPAQRLANIANDADWMAKTLFGHVMTIAPCDVRGLVVAVDLAQHGDGDQHTSTPTTADAWIRRDDVAFSVECKTRIVNGKRAKPSDVDDGKGSYQINYGSNKTICDAHLLFAILWKQGVTASAQFATIYDFLNAIRRIVVVDRDEFVKAKLKTRNSVRLCPAKLSTSSPTETETVGGRPVLTTLHVITGGQDEYEKDIAGGYARWLALQHVGQAIASWAQHKTIKED